MKKKGLVGGVLTAIIMVCVIVCLVACVEIIPTGYEGVVYSMAGGVEEETLGQGWRIVSPTKKVKEFTISNEQLNLIKENKGEDNSLKVTTADDASISASFQMSYRFKPGKDLINTYKKFRGMDGEEIVNNRVKSVLQSRVSEVTSDYTMMEIYSGSRSEINKKITEYLNNEFIEDYGIEVIDASIVDVHPDKSLQKAIDNRVKALQEKQQAQAEQEKAKVEAETARIKAENKAAIKILEAEAEAKANKAISDSITPELIDMAIAEARKEHGWVEIQGVNTVVDNK